MCVLRVNPLTAELWDGPASKAVAAFEFVKSRLIGGEPNLGESTYVDAASRRMFRGKRVSARKLSGPEVK